MQRIKPDVDVIRDILQAVLAAQPASGFVISLLHQYDERGGLSKKQLQGLHSKAMGIRDLPAGRLATLEAIILRRPTRYKPTAPSPGSVTIPNETDKEETGETLTRILARYPAHKRVLFLKSKFDHQEPLSPAEKLELARFAKMLMGDRDQPGN